MKTSIILLAFALSAGCAQAASDGPITARDLFERCSAPMPKTPPDELRKKNPTNKEIWEFLLSWAEYHKNTKDIMACRSYVIGIADGIGSFAHLYKVKDCVPSGATSSDLQEIYVRFYSSHPESRHLEANAMVTAAFIDSFNCRYENKF